MEDKEDNFIPISALQHFLYCERQCALIHIEQVWQENRFTLEGEFMHEKVDDQKVRSQGADVRIEYGLMMKSMALGLSGKADVVEFHKNTEGKWIPYPVEYKRGKPKENRCDEVQLCAQALCLEEMIGVKISGGALFYGKTRRRKDVVFDEELRNLTIGTIDRLHRLIDERKTPAPAYEKEKCDNCSLQELCMPKAMRKNVEKYIDEQAGKPVLLL
ncbi:MAG: CRISPR-associated protein Cas4 [Victivallales bacterium]